MSVTFLILEGRDGLLLEAESDVLAIKKGLGVGGVAVLVIRKGLGVGGAMIPSCGDAIVARWRTAGLGRGGSILGTTCTEDCNARAGGLVSGV